jgi:hypothetical protein
MQRLYLQSPQYRRGYSHGVHSVGAYISACSPRCAYVQVVASEYGVVVIDKEQPKTPLAKKRQELISDEDVDDLAPR